MTIDSVQKLRKIYRQPSERALKKDIGMIDNHAKRFIAYSPFCVVSTFNKRKEIDVSPRGGQKGFVKISEKGTLLLPDSRGNNRLDCLTNIIETSRIGIIFFIPGIDETLRINGSARISTDKNYLELFKESQFKCISVVEIAVEELFMHCAKALMRSGLWKESSKVSEDALPSMGQVLKDQLNLNFKAESREETRLRYSREL